MIYLYLMSDEVPLDSVRIENTPQHAPQYARPTKTKMNGPYQVQPKDSHLEHFMTPAIMGNDFAVEICQTFYKHASLVIACPYETDLILRDGPLLRHPQCRPYNFIRRLEIELCFVGDWMARKMLEDDNNKGHYELLAYDVSQVGMIKPLNGYDLHVRPRFDSAGGMAKMEEVLVPVVYKLKEKGVNVKVSAVPIYPSHNASFDYEKPLSEWEEKIRTDSVFVSIRTSCNHLLEADEDRTA